MSDSIRSFVKSLKEDSKARDVAFKKQMDADLENANRRVAEQKENSRRSGFHRADKYVNSRGFSEVPRQFTVGCHSDTRDYRLYAANSYESAIAISELMQKREF